MPATRGEETDLSPDRPKWARSSCRNAPARSRNCPLELGGNAPFIVFDDADLDAAVQGACQQVSNTGQTCVAATRFLIQAGVYEEFAKRLKSAVAQTARGRWASSACRPGTVDRCQGGDQSRRTHCGCVPRVQSRPGRQAAMRSAAHSSKPTILTDVKPKNCWCARGNVRTCGAVIQIRKRKRKRIGWPMTRNSACRLSLHARNLARTGEFQKPSSTESLD